MKAKLRKIGRRARPCFLTSVSLLLVFVLATHTFWCSSISPLCASTLEPSAAHHERDCATPATHCEHHGPADNHQHDTCCGGIDETQTAGGWHKISLKPESVIIVDTASLLKIAEPLVIAENLYRRDGPEVRVLRSQHNRSLLSYRGPPVSA